VTDFDREPVGHGHEHWHAGVDVATPCGTEIHLPSGIEQATVTAVDNPGGYGTALVVHLQGQDVWLGHLRQRLVQNGQTVKAGAPLAISNNTGNSTGCHIHFEVRRTGGQLSSDNGGYGSDVDPTVVLTSGVNSQTQFDPLAGLTAQLGQEIQQAEQSFAHVVINGGAVALGTGLTLGGLLLAAYGLRGGTVAQAAVTARSAFSRGRGQPTPTGRRSAPVRPRTRPQRGTSPGEPSTGAQPEARAPEAIGDGPAPARVRAARGARRAAGPRRPRLSDGGRAQREAATAQRRALMQEIRAARAIRKQGPGPDWLDASVRMRIAEGKLRELRAGQANAAAARVAK
jgi:murein DD-endopeptidase MepM/ murein hydrolase activator NlpD